MTRFLYSPLLAAIASLVVPALAHGEAILVFHMDDSASPIVDATGTYSGTYTGASYGENGPLLDGLGFDGNDTISVTPDAALNFDSRSFTIEMWLMQDSATRGTEEVVASKRDTSNTSQQNLHLRIYNNDSIRMDWYGNNITTSSGTFSADEWHHLAFTYDYDSGTNTGTRRIYLDGVIVGEQTGVSPYLGNSTNSLNVGSWGTAQYFHGLMDEFRVYDTALDEATVLAHYNLDYDDYTPVVPEPSTWGMLVGLATASLLGYVRRRRRN